MKNIPQPRIIGIYEIRCKHNSMVYVGKSEWVASRWGHHISSLMEGNHKSSKLQRDFDKYGIDSFTFHIVEILDNPSDLDEAEIKWIGKHRKSRLYNTNLLNNSKDTLIRRNYFLNQIKSDWISDNDNDRSRLIYGDAKKWFVNNAIKCNLIGIKNNEVTFNKVIKYLENEYGYCVFSRRVSIDGKQITCHSIHMKNTKQGV